MSIFQVVLLGLIATPVVLVAIAVLGLKRERRALVASVRALGCPACGAALAEESVRAAEELWHRHVAEIMAQNPDLKFRMGRPLFDAVCGVCGARLRFDRQSGKLEPVTIALAFESGESPGDR